MELCESDLSTLDCKYLEKDLKEALFHLHLLHIVHLDIKKDNISFSPHFNRFVFIDFGLAKVVKE
mgnify:CR=1 FL=1